MERLSSHVQTLNQLYDPTHDRVMLESEVILTLNTTGPIGLASLVTHGKVIVGSVRGSRILERASVEPHDACSEAAGVELRTLAF